MNKIFKSLLSRNYANQNRVTEEDGVYTRNGEFGLCKLDYTKKWHPQHKLILSNTIILNVLIKLVVVFYQYLSEYSK